MWDILLRIGGVESTVKNFNYCQMHQRLKGFSDFTFNITQPSGWQLNQINGDTEVEITAGNHEISGIIVNHKNNTSKNIKTIKGYDYTYKLQKIRINTTNLSHADPSSSEFKVIYNSTAFKTISEDLMTNTGFTIGSVDTYPSTGPDTNISLLLNYSNIIEAQDELSQIANDSNKTFEYWITKDKKWFMKNRKGSSTSVADLNDGVNFTITNWEGDSIRISKRIIVVGNKELKGIYPSTGFTPGDPEEVYYYPSSEQTILDELAHNLYDSYNAEINWVQGTVKDSNANIQLGDTITLQSNNLSVTATDYRVIELIKTFNGKSETLSIILTIGENNTRKKTLNELLTKNKGLVKYDGTTVTGEGISTLTYDIEYNGSSTNKSRLNFSLTSDNVGSASNILGAKLIVNRTALRYDTDDSTGDSTTGAGITNASSTTNAGITNASSTTNAGITNVAAGGSSFSQSSSSSAYETTSVIESSTLSSFTTLTSKSITAATQEIVGYLYLARGPSDGVQNIYIRFDTGGSEIDGYLIRVVPDTYNSFSYKIPQNLNGSTLYVKACWLGGGTANLYWGYSIKCIAPHTHSNTFNDANHTNNNSFNDANHTNNNSFNDTNHSNPITQDVIVPGGEAAHTAKFDINGTNRGEFTSFAVNDEETSDISTWVNSLGNYTIDVYPTTGKGRYKITAEISYFQET